MKEVEQWITEHYRELSGRTSVRAVAARMRKQGWPLWLALRILLGKKA